METILSQLNAEQIAECTRGRLSAGGGAASFAGVSIDTRTLGEGALFVAIRGPRHDGHAFIPKAIAAGARGVVADSAYRHPGDFPPGRVLIRVEDTHRALRDLAAAVRRRWRGTAVGITGSMGKTTTKEFVSQMLEPAFRVRRSPGNYNNLYGLPLAVFGLEQGDQVGVFEMGMSAPGEIAEMCRIVSPSVGVITNVAPVHLEFFGSLEGIARAKGELAEALPHGGVLVYNSQSPGLGRIAARFGGRRISFGFDAGADFRADQIEITGPEQTRFRLRWGGAERIATIPLAGAHYVMNALPAVALGDLYGLGPDAIAGALGRLQPASMRGRMLRFAEGFSVIDDSYNSNPEALRSMIDVLSRLPSFRRRILVAGPMLELGSASAALHYECGVSAAQAGLDAVIGVGGDSREIVRAALEHGMGDCRARFVEGTGEAAALLGRELRRGDLVLIKGSRGARMEAVVESLRSAFECCQAGTHHAG